MHLSTNRKREDVGTTIRSLLMTYQQGITIRKLEKDYEEYEYEPIPFKEFNCPTLHVFLKQLRDFVRIERVNDQLLLFPVDSEKSKHISEFVRHQKPHNQNKRNFKKPYYGYCATRPQVNINSTLLMKLVNCVYLCPFGLPMQHAMQFVNQFIRPLQITRQELEHQLKAISHLIAIYGDNLYPINRVPMFPQPYLNTAYVYNPTWQLSGNYYCQISKTKPVTAHERKPQVVPLELNKSEKIIPLVVKGTNNVYKPNDELKRLSFGVTPNEKTKNVKHDLPFESDKVLEKFEKDEQIRTNNAKEPCLQDMESTSETTDHEICKESSRCFTTLTKIKLSKLVDKFPNGIWVSELPQMYLEEYKTPLTYSKSEFSSVLDFVSHLTNDFSCYIFHCVRPLNETDYKLFNARNCLPDLKNDKGSNIHLQDFSRGLHLDNFKLSLLKDVMGIKDSVKHLSVNEFNPGNDSYEEIVISNVISPSFFWIHLRKNLMIFKTFVNHLNNFYENNSSKYKVPLRLLQKGLNVVCFFKDRWNRGLIKEVCEDSQVTICFYDYGIDKKCFPDEIYLLDQKFSNFPAQAIPCSLFNVKPYRTSDWSHDAIWQFISKTSFPLIANVKNVDLQENLLFVVLTDTRTDEDFHINDWLCNKKFGESGQCASKNYNFAFSHYKESLKQKGYDPLSLHYIRSEGLKLKMDDDEADNHVKNSPCESGKKMSEQCQPRLQKLLALYAKSKVSEDNLPPLKEITTVAEDKSTTEATVKSNCSKLLFLQKMNKLTISKCNGTNGSEDYKDENKPSTSNVSDLRSVTDDSISTSSLEESPKKPMTEMPYFGTFASECGGRGRMEPINWKEALQAGNNTDRKQQHEHEIPNENNVLEQHEELNDVPPQLRRLFQLQNKFKKK